MNQPVVYNDVKSIRGELVPVSFPDGEQSIRVKIGNYTGKKLSNVTVCFTFANQHPQPDEEGNLVAREHLDLFVADQGQSSLDPFTCPSIDHFREARFDLTPQQLKDILSVVVALEPKRYWIAVSSDSDRVLTIPGTVVGPFLDQFK